MTETVRRTPWFPDDDGQSSPSVVFTGQRVNVPLFGAVRYRSPRDADHYEMEPRSKPLDAVDLQEDSFVTFSVGNLERRNFSLLGMPKLSRESHRGDDGSDVGPGGGGGAGVAPARPRASLAAAWRRRPRKLAYRADDDSSDKERAADASGRETESTTQREREKAADVLFAPWRRCFIAAAEE